MADFPSCGSQHQLSLAPAAGPADGPTPTCFQKAAGPLGSQQQAARHPHEDIRGMQDARHAGAAAEGGGDPAQQQPDTDFVTSTLRQGLITDVESFFQHEVAPRTTAIAEVRRKLLACTASLHACMHACKQPARLPVGPVRAAAAWECKIPAVPGHSQQQGGLVVLSNQIRPPMPACKPMLTEGCHAGPAHSAVACKQQLSCKP